MKKNENHEVANLLDRRCPFKGRAQAGSWKAGARAAIRRQKKFNPYTPDAKGGYHRCFESGWRFGRETLSGGVKAATGK